MDIKYLVIQDLLIMQKQLLKMYGSGNVKQLKTLVQQLENIPTKHVELSFYLYYTNKNYVIVIYIIIICNIIIILLYFNKNIKHKSFIIIYHSQIMMFEHSNSKIVIQKYINLTYLILIFSIIRFQLY